MSKLKELTWEHHKEAERQDFVKVLLSGKIHPDFYATYLWNQHKKYDIIEALAMMHGILLGLPDIRQKNKIEEDYLELWNHENTPHLLPSTNDYLAHIKTIMHEPDKIMAHVYVMHMGDLSGGQMIAKKIPGQGRMYKFDGDIELIKQSIRDRTDDSMAEEARNCFSYASRLFQDLMELDCERYLEHPD